MDTLLRRVDAVCALPVTVREGDFLVWGAGVCLGWGAPVWWCEAGFLLEGYEHIFESGWLE